MALGVLCECARWGILVFGLIQIDYREPRREHVSL